MSGADYNTELKREIFSVARQQLPCCVQSFLAGLLRGSARQPQIKVRRALHRQLQTFLGQVLPPDAAIGSGGTEVMLDTNFDQLVLRQKLVERIKRTEDAVSGKHCQKAFLQGLFISRGYIQNPGQGYHLEFRLPGRWLPAAFKTVCRQLRTRFGEYKTDSGENCFYLKSIRRIIKFLNLLGLFEISLELSDLKATRGLLSMVNRQVNFETANINRLIGAAEESISQIEELLAYDDQEIWTESLRQLAMVRLKYPHDSLEALGQRFEPALSKSAVNHRLRRIKSLHIRLFGKIPEENA
ncbi:MAG: DNA-binding protein WhiA [Candidatus Riflebacteria bacterium HGW-Riflebacteria-2]|jgi:DNA-binding protein WhiA|nr:MAG: DNA-binding protein WhiA [Candidatus Riflebacteria bacterium HGW-Riflebacteria-2]